MGGKPEDAEEYIQNALRVGGPIGDKYDEALARIIYGEIRREQGRLGEAEQQVRMALSLARVDLKDESIEATALSNLASIQAETDLPGALKTYREALNLRQKNGEKGGVANCLNNMGDVLFRGGDLNGAEQHYRQALKIFNDDLKDSNGAAHGWLSLAEVDFERGDLAQAEDKASKALREFQAPEDKDADSESAASTLLVKIYTAGGKPLDAEPYVRRIKEIASKDRDVMFENRLGIAEYLNAIGKRPDALQQLQSLPSEAKAAGLNFLSLEARLALVKLRAVERPDPNLSKELSSIRTDATRAGFRLLADKAARAHP